MRVRFVIAALIGGSLAGCGGSVAIEDGGGGGTTTAVVSSSSGVSQPGWIFRVSAPTQYTVLVEFDGAVPELGKSLDYYQVDEAFAGSSVMLQAIALAPTGDSITLTTSKQKLGLNYTLTVADLDSDGWSFPSADTALFWTVDLSSPAFNETELVAERVRIGDHAVVYMAEGESAFNVPAAVSYFDNTIYPIETGAFHPAPDQDDNGKVVLLGVDGKGAFGGYFNPIDTFTDEQAQQYGYHSNETEVLYINVEDGVIDAEHVVAHEFMHMLYHEHPAHDSIFDDWSWHNEGMAECGVRLVTGANDYAPYFYVEDPYGDIAQGLSMVDWQGGNYSQYALSYLFLSYVAGQLGGPEQYPQLFELIGSPDSIGTLSSAALGMSFAEAQRNAMIAAQVQASNGVYSYNGMVGFPGFPAVGQAPLTLPPFAGAFVMPSTTSVSYPANKGLNIIYAAVTPQGQVDLVEPFDTQGGRLLVFNSSVNVNDLSPEPSGNLLPAVSIKSLAADVDPARSAEQLAATDASKAALRQLGSAYARMHPPPFNPTRLDHMRAWQQRSQLRD